MTTLLSFFSNPFYTIPTALIGVYLSGLFRIVFVVIAVSWFHGMYVTTPLVLFTFFLADFLFYKDVADIITDEKFE